MINVCCKDAGITIKKRALDLSTTFEVKTSHIPRVVGPFGCWPEDKETTVTLAVAVAKVISHVTVDFF